VQNHSVLYDVLVNASVEPPFTALSRALRFQRGETMSDTFVNADLLIFLSLSKIDTPCESAYTLFFPFGGSNSDETVEQYFVRLQAEKSVFSFFFV